MPTVVHFLGSGSEGVQKMALTGTGGEAPQTYGMQQVRSALTWGLPETAPTHNYPLPSFRRESRVRSHGSRGLADYI